MSKDEKNQKDKEAVRDRSKRPAPKKSVGTSTTTSISVDEQECRVADTILSVLEQEKGKTLLRMLRLNRISILRLALGEGLNVLTAKLEKGERIL